MYNGSQAIIEAAEEWNENSQTLEFPRPAFQVSHTPGTPNMLPAIDLWPQALIYYI